MSFNVPFFGRTTGSEKSRIVAAAGTASATGDLGAVETLLLIANLDNVMPKSGAGKPSFTYRDGRLVIFALRGQRKKFSFREVCPMV